MSLLAEHPRAIFLLFRTHKTLEVAQALAERQNLFVGGVNSQNNIRNVQRYFASFQQSGWATATNTKPASYSLTPEGERMLISVEAEVQREAEEREAEKKERERIMAEANLSQARIQEAELAEEQKKRQKELQENENEVKFLEAVNKNFWDMLIDPKKGVVYTMWQRIMEANDKDEVVEIDAVEFDKMMGEYGIDLVYSNPKRFIGALVREIKQKLLASEKQLCRTLLNSGHFLMFRNNKPFSRFFIKVSEINTFSEGKFALIEGTIKARSEKLLSYTYQSRPFCTVCQWQGGWRHHSYPQRATLPQRCGNTECNLQHTVRLEEKKENRWVIVIEEDAPDSGAQQTSIVGILQPHLCTKQYLDHFKIVGTRLICGGVLRERETFKRDEKDPLALRHRFFDVVTFDMDSTDWKYIEVSPENKIKFREICKKPTKERWEILCRSFAPHIKRQDLVKKALVLAMIGAGKPNNPEYFDGNGVLLKDKKPKPTHILMVGDPSTAKTQLMNSIQTLIPRTRRGSGGGMSGVGITGAMIKNEETGQWTVEAGIVPLANNSIALLDEFQDVDKANQNLLKDGMEDLEIKITKAGVDMTLLCNTTIIASMNPKQGVFVPNTSLTVQFNIEEPVLNRFVLKLAIRDIVNIDADREIARSILGTATLGVPTKPPLSENDLKQLLAFIKDEAPTIYFPNEMKDRLENYYVDIRQLGMKKNTRTVVPRNLRDLWLLALAHTKLRMSDRVEDEDIDAVIELYNEYLKAMGMDEEGTLDALKLMTGRSSATATANVHFRAVFEELEKKDPSEGIVSEEAFVGAFLAKGYSEDDFQKRLEALTRDGTLWSPRTGQLKRMTKSWYGRSGM